MSESRNPLADVLVSAEGKPVHIWAFGKPTPGTAELRKLHRLSPAQSVVAQLLVARRTNGEIAEFLGISICTVRTHVAAVMLKLNVSSRLDVERALQR